MGNQIFVNLPVADLKKSMAFFQSLGFGFNPQFTDDKAACMVVNDSIHVMLLTREFFGTFVSKPVADTRAVVGAITTHSPDASTSSRVNVDCAMTAASFGGSKSIGMTHAAAITLRLPPCADEISVVGPWFNNR